VAPPRLELGHTCVRRILNPLRLPFRQEAIRIVIDFIGRRDGCQLSAKRKNRIFDLFYLNLMSSRASLIENRKKFGPICFLSS
jgi:hypothetical protein